MKHLITRIACILTLIVLVGCDVSSSGSNLSTVGDSGLKVSGAGVKGPLVGANVHAYKMNTLRPDLKGDLIAIGSTDSMARLQLEIPSAHLGNGPFLIEYSNGTELNGSTPAITVLRTILTNAQLATNTPVYATPLSTFAIDYANAIADTADNLAVDNPLTDNLAGDNDGVVSTEEFLAALVVSQRNIGNTLGLGLIDDDIDLFTTPPLITENADQQDTLAIRTANEVFAAIVSNMADESATNGLSVSGADVVHSLAMDFSDGQFDKQQGNQPISNLQYVADIESTITSDPDALLVPGTSTPISAITDLLVEETETISPDIPSVDLEMPIIETPQTSVFDNDDGDAGNPGNSGNSPSVSLAVPTGNASIEEGQSFGVLVNASDSDGNLDHCRLTLNGQLVRQIGSAPFSWGNQSNTNDTMLNNMLADNYGVVVTCTDTTGLSNSVSFALLVNEVSTPTPPEPTDIPPQVSFSQIEPANSLIEGANLTITVDALDEDGSIEFCSLAINGVELADETAAPYQWSHSSSPALANVAAGSYTLIASCTDDSGLNDAAVMSVIVAEDNTPEPPTPEPGPDPTAPSVSFEHGSSDSIEAGNDYNVVVNASDSDGNIDNCKLYLDGAFVRQENYTPFAWPAVKDNEFQSMAAGNYEIEAVCTDNDNQSTSATLSLEVTAATVPAQLPTVSFSSPINTAIVEGNPVSVSLDANDSDGTIEYCELRVNGTLVRQDSEAPYAFGDGSGFADTALGDLPLGSYTLDASCTDNDQQSSSTQTTITIIPPEEEPTYSNISLSWSIPTTREDGSMLSISEIAGYEIYFYADGSTLGSGQSFFVEAQTQNGSLVGEYLITNVPTGSYWLAIATIDTDGTYSDIATPTMITLP